MARQRKSSAAEDLIDLMALLPRWASLGWRSPATGCCLSSPRILRPAGQSAQQSAQLATTAMAC